MSDNEDEVRWLFGPFLNEERFDELLLVLNKKASFSLSKILDLCSLSYIAPGDAADTQLADQSVDFHTSYAVFEHIPSSVLKRILKEGSRIIKPNGLFVHRIDYSDHFAHTDKNISAINFLKYTDVQWNRIAGNRYMYMNRLRHDDFLNMFDSVGHQVIVAQSFIDKRSQNLLRSGNLQLCERFNSKSKEVLAITGAWIISKKTDKTSLRHKEVSPNKPPTTGFTKDTNLAKST